MTYAEKIADSIIQEMNALPASDRAAKAYSVITEHIEQAMQAQREACAAVYAARYETQKGTRNHEIYQIIRNAEV